MHDRDLRDSGRRQARLVVEDAPEVLPIREHLILSGKIGATALDEVDAREAVLRRDLLRPQMLFDRDGVVGTPLHRRVVRNDDAFPATDAPDASNDASTGDVSTVKTVRSQLAHLQKGTPGVQQHADAFPRGQLARLPVLLQGGSRAALGRARDLLPQSHYEGPQSAVVLLKLLRMRVDLRGQCRHPLVSFVGLSDNHTIVQNRKASHDLHGCLRLRLRPG